MDSVVLVGAIPPFPYAGEIFSIGAAVIWSCSLSTYRVYGEVVSSQTLNLYKNLVAIFCLLATIVFTGAPFPKSMNEWLFLIGSGLAGIAIGDTAYFASLRRAGAQLSSAIQCLAPPMAAILAVVLLGETLSRRETIGIIVTVGGLAGLLWIRRRDSQTSNSTVSRQVLALGVTFAVLSALGQALGVVLSRQVMKDVNIFAGSALRIFPAVIVLTLLGLIVGSRKKRPSNRELGIVSPGIGEIFRHRKTAFSLTLAAFFGTFIGIVLMTAGVKYAKAGVAAALSSSYPIFIIPIAHFILKERVTLPMIFMTFISVGGIAYMFL